MVNEFSGVILLLDVGSGGAILRQTPFLYTRKLLFAIVLGGGLAAFTKCLRLELTTLSNELLDALVLVLDQRLVKVARSLDVFARLQLLILHHQIVARFISRVVSGISSQF